MSKDKKIATADAYVVKAAESRPRRDRKVDARAATRAAQARDTNRRVASALKAQTRD